MTPSSLSAPLPEVAPLEVGSVWVDCVSGANVRVFQVLTREGETEQWIDFEFVNDTSDRRRCLTAYFRACYRKVDV